MASESRQQDQCLALGALLGCSIWVHRVAEGARLDASTQDYLLAPTLAKDSESVSALLPPGQVRRSLLADAKKSLRGSTESTRVLGYAVELMELTARLRNHSPVSTKLAESLAPLSEPTPAVLADVYQQSISTLGRRVQVRGNAQALQDEDTAATIRALLLAGVRYAWLWHQLGGRRWHLLLKRSAILTAMSRLEAQAELDPIAPS